VSESNYIKALEEYAEALNEAAQIANDPYKAPEVVVETTTPLLSAIWKVQVQAAAMLNADK
jgi:hypothetical protein